MYNITIFYWRE